MKVSLFHRRPKPAGCGDAVRKKRDVAPGKGPGAEKGRVQ